MAFTFEKSNTCPGGRTPKRTARRCVMHIICQRVYFNEQGGQTLVKSSILTAWSLENGRLYWGYLQFVKDAFLQIGCLGVYICLMFSLEQYPLFQYTPDKARENSLHRSYLSLEQKLLYLHLSTAEIKELAEYCRRASIAATIAMDHGVSVEETPAGIYEFCIYVAENLPDQYEHFEKWSFENFKDVRFTTGEQILKIHQSIHQGQQVIINQQRMQRFIQAIAWWNKHPADSMFLQALWLRLIIQGIKPLNEKNQAYAAAAYNFFLKKNKYALNGLLFPNVEFKINSQPFMDATDALSFNWPAEPVSVQQAYEEYLGLMERHFQRINKRLKEIFRGSWNYEFLSPRSRNKLNYLFEMYASRGELNKMEELNDRQRKIFYKSIYEDELTNKELWIEFRCERKTIQRDFQKLLSLGLLRQTGKGAQVRYIFDLTSGKREEALEQLYYFQKQTPVYEKEEQELREEPQQQDLFS